MIPRLAEGLIDRSRWRLLLVALSLALAACATPGAPPLRGDPLAEGDPRPGAFLAAMEARAQRPLALRARARLSLDAPDLKVRRPQRLALERPSRMRVEIMGLLGQVAAVLVTDGLSYQLYQSGEPGLEEGTVDAHLLWRVARVDLDPLEAVDLLLGGPAPEPTLRIAQAVSLSDGGIAVDQVDAEGALFRRVQFDAAGRLRRLARFDARGALRFEAIWSDHRPLPAPDGTDWPFAFEIRLRFPRVEAEAVFEYKKVKLVESLDDGLFVLRLAGSA